jgi:ribosome maturation factor RimP
VERAHLQKTIDKRGLIELLEPTLRRLGYELVDIDLNLGRNGLLRLFIDRDIGVTLADCELVSEQIGALLDVEDPLPGHYVLEISSPGLDRRLRTIEHFERFLDEDVKIELVRPRNGRKRFRGRLVDAGGQRVVVEVDGERCEFELAEIAMARLVPKK